MYKILFIDIDGTLLTSQHLISKGTLSAIQRISEIKKIPVILTSARPPQAVEKIYKQLNLNSPIVCFNGALILEKYNNNGFTHLLSSTVDIAYLNVINRNAIENNLSVNFYEMGKWFSNSYTNWINQEEEITETKVTILNTHLQIQQWTTENEGPHKILLMGDPGKIDSTELQIIKHAGHHLNIYKSKPTYLEITNGAASKVSAIIFLLKKYGLASKDVLAIGDNYNDIEMLKLAGLGIAMGNSPDEVKSQARFITLDNDSEGIKFALDMFIN
ncbi:MAG: Cof-type HAD-IIB family hydrolase [Ferruginibacter sp.]